MVITDEVYEHLTFDGPRARADRDAARDVRADADPVERRQVLLVTGWKVGWATGPADLVAAVLAAKQWLTFTSGAPLQPAVAARARRASPDLPRGAGRRASRSGATCSATGWRRSGSHVRRPEGTYFATTDISAWAGRTAWRSAWRCPSGPAWWRSRPSRSTTAGRGRPAGPVGVLQGAVGDRGGAAPARGRRPRSLTGQRDPGPDLGPHAASVNTATAAASGTSISSDAIAPSTRRRPGRRPR